MDAESRTVELLRRSPRVRQELLEKIARGEVRELERFGVAADRLSGFLEGRPAGPALEGAEGAPSGPALEAIVRRYGRPVILIRGNTYERPELDSVAEQLAPHQARIERAIPRVGRIEFLNHRLSWGGTGWVVDRNIVVTNRHVADLVAEDNGRGGFRFRISRAGVPCGARIDFREEHEVREAEERPLESVRYLARADRPDIALLEVAGADVPEPLPLSDANAEVGRLVGVIGYPAFDSRSDAADVARYFGDVFDVKRLAPGEVTQAAGEQPFFMHDATTLGGNSGSVVLDLATGEALGLHFAGTYLEGNFAVTAEQVRRALRGLKATVTVPADVGRVERADGSHPPEHFAGRSGYEPIFLGRGSRKVPLPGLGPWAGDAAVPAAGTSDEPPFLPYTHFSVAYSSSRRVPILTAVNIDGSRSRKIKRGGDQWFFDLRIPRALQLTQDDYGHPDIDRGHMVRREDPNWGTMAVAEVANDDTFHYTNAAPQHSRLNQGRAQWLGLEEYVLGSARTHGLKVSVFTGPILRETDPALDNGVKVPEEFWKVVVALDEQEKLRATGYVLSQGQLIEDITESFVYGEYRTYQVKVQAIADATRLDFGELASLDPLSRRPPEEAIAGMPPVVALDRLESMLL